MKNGGAAVIALPRPRFSWPSQLARTQVAEHKAAKMCIKRCHTDVASGASESCRA